MPASHPREQQRLVIIGAGPKGLAVALKAKVLSELGFAADHVTLVERHGVAAHWSGRFGYTNGELKLGTSPEKDLVFPIEGDGSPHDSQDALDYDPRVRRRLQEFTWAAFLTATNRYADWIDRGRPAPCHGLWAGYLTWVGAQLEPHATIVRAEVVGADITGDATSAHRTRLRWSVELRDARGHVHHIPADRLMLTGPGRPRLDFRDRPNSQDADPLPHGVSDLETFWRELARETFPQSGRIAIIGAGENAASALLALGRFRGLDIDVVSPRGFISTRAEHSYENRFYSKPQGSGWSALEPLDRSDFIRRTDLGVFSDHAMRLLNEQRQHRIVPGRLVALARDAACVTITLEYGGTASRRVYDRVILATGFDQAATLATLLAPRAREALERCLGRPLSDDALTARIGHDLAVEGFSPGLHLPMLAGFTQGPGFANLSCLGLLSDRVLGVREARGRRAQTTEKPAPQVRVAALGAL